MNASYLTVSSKEEEKNYICLLSPGSMELGSWSERLRKIFSRPGLCNAVRRQ